MHLASAQVAVRQLTARDHDDDITVIVHDGQYPITGTLVFDSRDVFRPGPSGDRHGVTYAAAPGERPVLTSGVTITNWQPVADTIPGLPAAAVGRLYSADIPAIDGQPLRPKTLCDGDRRTV